MSGHDKMVWCIRTKCRRDLHYRGTRSSNGYWISTETFVRDFDLVPFHRLLLWCFDPLSWSWSMTLALFRILLTASLILTHFHHHHMHHGFDLLSILIASWIISDHKQIKGVPTNTVCPNSIKTDEIDDVGRQYFSSSCMNFYPRIRVIGFIDNCLFCLFCCVK